MRANQLSLLGHLVVLGQFLSSDETIGPRRIADREAWCERRLRELEDHCLIERCRVASVRGRVSRLTHKGLGVLLHAQEAKKAWSRRWDGVIRAIAYDLPEHDATLRCQLRRVLKAERFGHLQRSLWITPHQPSSLQHRPGLRLADSLRGLVWFELRPLEGASLEALVLAAWPFGELSQLHECHEGMLNRRPQADWNLQRRKNWLEAELASWERIEDLDPLLPYELHPRAYRGKELLLLRERVFRELAVSSDVHPS